MSSAVKVAQNPIGGYDNCMSQTANTAKRRNGEKALPKPAKQTQTVETLKNVVVPIYEGITLLDLAGPTEALHYATALSEAGTGYCLHYVCADQSDWVTSSTGLPIKGVRFSDLPDDVHTLLIPGAEEHALAAAISDAGFISALASVAARAERLASVCTGAFFLGTLGVLNGRRATTHWAGVADLQARFPDARVAQDRLYERDGPVWTSAGVLSGVDMALALIEHDLSRDIAMATARRLVAFLVRNGGQSQFSAPISLQGKAGNDRISALVAYLQERLESPVDVADMARAAAMSERTLHRRCKEHFGMTPMQLLAELRLEHARVLLLDAKSSIKSVALSSGYATSSSLTKAFTERYGVAPSHYRAHFA